MTAKFSWNNNFFSQDDFPPLIFVAVGSQPGLKVVVLTVVVFGVFRVAGSGVVAIGSS